MTDIGPFRPGDRAAILALYARVFDDAQADALAARWEWTYQQNPALPGGVPRIWVLRDGDTVQGQYATIPVRLAVLGREIDAAWGADVMIAPELQGKGFGDALFRTWDAGSGAAIGLSLTDASHKLFLKLRWPYVGAVPRFAKAISDSAKQRFGEQAPSLVSRLVGGLRGRPSPAFRADADVIVVQSFDERFTALWERVAPHLAFGVRRDAAYLTWRYLRHPTVRYEALALVRHGAVLAWAVVRHLQEEAQQVTVLVDYLADPADPAAFDTVLAAVHASAADARADVVRTWAMHADYRAALERAGYKPRGATLRFVAKINDVGVSDEYYAEQDRWHVTRGDSDCDR